jgi:hypothetical protein
VLRSTLAIRPKFNTNTGFITLKIVIPLVLAVYWFNASATDFDLYFLGGQSNMAGYGENAELPPQLQQPQESYIFWGQNGFPPSKNAGFGLWKKVQPGFGEGVSYQKQQLLLSNRFGLELSFVQRISSSSKNPIAIIKYATGGTSLAIGAGYDDWHPHSTQNNGINQYDYFLTTISNAYADIDIDNDGHPDRLIPKGIVWMQGEADAQHSKTAASDYLGHLRQLMTLIRASFRDSTIPVLIGKINDSKRESKAPLMPHIALVHQAQRQFVAADVCAGLVTSTDNASYKSDPWHYDSKTYIQLGYDFADAFSNLNCEK